MINQPNLDRVAIAISVVCALHCAVTPILLSVFPLLSMQFVDEHTFHLMLLTLIIPSSVIAMVLGCKKHKDAIVFLLGATALVTLVITAIFGHDLFTHMGEVIMTVSATALLSIAHWRNYTLCKGKACCHK